MTDGSGFNPEVPSAAQVYDYLLGGKDNLPVDREVGEHVIATVPGVQTSVRWNRGFLHRLVRYLVTEAGITQIIDIGAGLPTVGNTHEIAQATRPGTRVVYVDNDPVVLARARDMLHGTPDTAVIRHDLRDPGSILADQRLRELIRFDEPCAFLMLSMLHFIPDQDDPAALISRLLEPFPSGSHVGISHGTTDRLADFQQSIDDTFNDAAAEKADFRTRDQVLDLVAGLDLVSPGLTWIQDWRPELGEMIPGNAREAFYYGVVARKP